MRTPKSISNSKTKSQKIVGQEPTREEIFLWETAWKSPYNNLEVYNLMLTKIFIACLSLLFGNEYLTHGYLVPNILFTMGMLISLFGSLPLFGKEITLEINSIREEIYRLGRLKRYCLVASSMLFVSGCLISILERYL